MLDEVNEKQNAAIGWLVVFGCSLLGVLALPIFARSSSVLEQDGAQIGPLLLLLAVLLGAALAGRTRPFASGFAAGIVALLALVLGVASVFGVVFSVLLGDFGDGVEWSGGAFAVVIAAASGVVVVLFSGQGRRGHSPKAWTPVAVCGAVAVVVMVVGAAAPRNGGTWEDALGFSAHPIVGLGITAFLAGIAGVGVAGFSTGRWGVGLLTGFLGYLLFGWLSSRSGTQGEVAAWSGVTSDVQPAAAIAFWAAAGLFVVHAVQQATTAPDSDGTSSVEREPLTSRSERPFSTSTTLSPRSTPPPPSPPISGWWAADPFERFINRYFDGTHWTDKVSSTGEVHRDKPVHAVPADGTAAWLPDPFGRHQHRYFTGKKWSAHVADDGRAAEDEPVASTPEKTLGASQLAAAPVVTEPTTPVRPPAVSSTTPPPLLEQGELDSETVLRSNLPVATPDLGLVSVNQPSDDLDLADDVIVGRAPAPAESHPHARLHSVQDRTVSKSHALFGRDDDGVWVIDLHSRNGVVIAGVSPEAVKPGRPHRLNFGDVVVLGDVTVYEVGSRQT